ncbi:MAG: hypothetical protein ACK559_31430, partial [bacterium]
MVAEPWLFVKMARNCVPLSADVSEAVVKVIAVSPAMLLQPAPEFFCHCTVGMGQPVAAAVKLAVVPALAVVSA